MIPGASGGGGNSYTDASSFDPTQTANFGGGWVDFGSNNAPAGSTDNTVLMVAALAAVVVVVFLLKGK